VIGSPHVLGDETWLMLRGLGVHEQEQETCVEELSVEYTVRDGGLLLTLGVLTDPVHQVNDDQLKDHIHTDYNEGDGLPNDFGPDDIVIVLQTNLARVDDFSTVVLLRVYFRLTHAVGLLVLAEALHCSGEMCFLHHLLCQGILFVLNDCILLPEVMSSSVILRNLKTVHFWILFLLGKTCLRAGENNGERHREGDQDDDGHDDLLHSSLLRGVVPVFPNDVCRFRSRLDLNLLLKDSLVLGILLNFDRFVVVECSLVALFRLESGKDRARGLHLVEEVIVPLDGLSNLLVDLSDLVPFLILDVCSPLSQPLDDFGVVESKGYKCDLDGSDIPLGPIKAEGWHSCQCLLKLILNEQFELSDLRDRVR
jgi:hypothetical protein